MQDSPSIAIAEIPDAVLVISRDGSIVSANADAERLFGYSRNELAGLALEVLIPERYRAQHGRLVEGFFAKPETRPMGIGRELQGLKSDGQEFPVEIAIGPTAGDSHVVAVIRDISAAVQVRDELRHKEERFRAAAASTADLIWEADMLAETVDWFGDIDQMLGYDPGSFPRTVGAWIESIHPDDIDEVNQCVERIVETGEGFHARYRVRHKDGTYRHWEDRARVIGWIDGRGNNIVGSITDITDRVVAQQKLEHALTEVELLKDRLVAESQYLQAEIKSEHNFEQIIGNSGPMRATLLKVEKVAPTNTAVLVLGETGTGKELLARAIHSRSDRSDRPLIKIDCATIPAGLVESELFGHEKGAFTGATQKKQGRFELAHCGTVFLDEIGDLPLDLQTKLLRVLEEGVIKPVGSETDKNVDVRVIAATNRNLKDEVKNGRFRSDLYYRLSVFLVESPPLRDRREDIPLLTTFFISSFSTALGKNIQAVNQISMDRLMSYDWPGNIRELRNVLERAAILCEGDTLDVEDFLGAADGRDTSLKGDLRSVERARILRALEESRWKIKGENNAANRLGLNPSTLRARMSKLGIERPH
jgi:PAS domain S-box-containing protein